MKPAPLFFCLLAGAACNAKPARQAQHVPPSVLLVTIDTLRADRLGAYGDGRARTPNLDSLARAGARFAHAFAAAPVTLPSHASLLTGLLPPEHGVRGNGVFRLGPRSRTLAEALKARGYATGAFVAAAPLNHRYGLGRGFDAYDDAFLRRGGTHFELAERPAADVTAAALAWLSAQRSPVFLWVHYFDPHHPYDPPAAFRGDDPYRGEIASVDASFGGLLSAWDARAQEGGSIVAVTADHGEAFGEHREESHSLFVYDTTLHVPLLVRAAGVAAGTVIERSIATTDLAATLLQLANAGAPLPGHDLFAPGGAAAGTPLYAETLAPRLDFGWSDLRAWRDGRYKFIRAPRPELYDVAADPGEAHDLAASEPETARRLSRALEDYLAKSGDAQTLARADPAESEALRSLGYVQGPGGRGSGADPKDKVDIALAISRAGGPFANDAEMLAAYRKLVRLDPRQPAPQPAPCRRPVALGRRGRRDSLLRARHARGSAQRRCVRRPWHGARAPWPDAGGARGVRGRSAGRSAERPG